MDEQDKQQATEGPIDRIARATSTGQRGGRDHGGGPCRKIQVVARIASDGRAACPPPSRGAASRLLFADAVLDQLMAARGACFAQRSTSPTSEKRELRLLVRFTGGRSSRVGADGFPVNGVAVVAVTSISQTWTREGAVAFVLRDGRSRKVPLATFCGSPALRSWRSSQTRTPHRYQVAESR